MIIGVFFSCTNISFHFWQVCRQSAVSSPAAAAACRWSPGSSLRTTWGASSWSPKDPTVQPPKSCKPVSPPALEFDSFFHLLLQVGARSFQVATFASFALQQSVDDADKMTILKSQLLLPVLPEPDWRVEQRFASTQSLPGWRNWSSLSWRNSSFGSREGFPKLMPKTTMSAPFFPCKYEPLRLHWGYNDD